MAREDTNTSIANVNAGELGDLYKKGYEFVNEIHLFPQLNRTLYRQRYQAQREQNEPTSSEDVVLDEGDLKMVDGSSLPLVDDEEEEGRIIILAGAKRRECLKL